MYQNSYLGPSFNSYIVIEKTIDLSKINPGRIFIFPHSMAVLFYGHFNLSGSSVSMETIFFLCCLGLQVTLVYGPYLRQVREDGKIHNCWLQRICCSLQEGGRSVRRSKGVGTCRLDCHCMGSNPARGSYENGRWDDPLHRRCPKDPKQDMSGRPANDS